MTDVLNGAEGRCDVAVVILTNDEELNLPHALASVAGWAREVVVIDSFSADATVEIARAAGCRVVQHPFENYARQRNFALTVPMEAEWIFFLDADEWIPPDLKEEISTIVASRPAENGFFVKWRMIWMGKWIRRGYYPTWVLRMFRRGAGKCEDRSVNEHFVVEGALGYLRNDFMHEDRKGLDHWIAKHVRYAAREAEELIRQESRIAAGEIEVRFWGTQAQRKRWVRYRVWNRLPPLARPFLYFFYRLVVKGGFLDGKRAVIYHVLHALWFPFLIDAKYIEMKRSSSSAGPADPPA